MISLKKILKEAKADYQVYHKTYSAAIATAKAYAEKKGYEVDDEDSFRKIGMGPRKPLLVKQIDFQLN